MAVSPVPSAADDLCVAAVWDGEPAEDEPGGANMPLGSRMPPLCPWDLMSLW